MSPAFGVATPSDISPPWLVNGFCEEELILPDRLLVPVVVSAAANEPAKPLLVLSILGLVTGVDPADFVSSRGSLVVVMDGY